MLMQKKWRHNLLLGGNTEKYEFLISSALPGSKLKGLARCYGLLIFKVHKDLLV